jgi:hypothetical protein
MKCLTQFNSLLCVVVLLASNYLATNPSELQSSLCSRECSLVTKAKYQESASYESRNLQSIATGSEYLHEATSTCNSNDFLSNYYYYTSKRVQNNKNNNAHITKTTKYLLYDVNAAEGFNLRRDVYIRMAKLVKLLNK